MSDLTLTGPQELEAVEPADPIVARRRLLRLLGDREMLVVLVTAAAMVVHGNWLLAAAATVAVIGWLGCALAALAGVTTGTLLGRVLVAAGAGLPGLIVLWLPANLVADADWAPPWLWRPLLALSLGAAAMALRWRLRRNGLSVFTWLDAKVDVLSIVLLVVPPASAALSAVLVASGRASAFGFVVTATLFVVLALIWRRCPGRFPVALFSLFWSLALMTSFRSPHLFGFDIQQEFGVATLPGPWSPRAGADPYEAMLSITLLPRSLAACFGLSPLTFFKLLAPAALALAALGCWRMCCLWAGEAVAAIAALTLVVLTPTYQLQMPAIARQELAFLVLMSAMVVGHSNDIHLPRRRLFMSAQLASLGFIHYTTSYVVVAMLTIAYLVGRLTLREQRPLFMVTARSLVAVVSVVGLWNFVVTDSGSGLTRSVSELRAEGADLLPSGGNVFESWISGTSVRPLTAAEYSDAMAARTEPGGDLSWMTPSRFAGQFPLEDSASPALVGVAPWLAPIWRLVAVGYSQGVLVASLVLTAISLRAAVRRKDPFLMLLACFVTGSVLFSAMLRLSGSASSLYNPERQALLTALFTAPLIAAALEWGFHRLPVRLISYGAACVATIISVGLSPVLFGGAPSPAHSTGGESVERFTVRSEDVAAALWLNDAPPPGGLVQTDRYGQLALLAVGDRHFGWVPTVAPVAVDENAYVLEASTNARTGRGRGDDGGALSIFVFPSRFLDATRSPVYVNGEVTVWR